VKELAPVNRMRIAAAQCPISRRMSAPLQRPHLRLYRGYV
jgi:hypothetical protein